MTPGLSSEKRGSWRKRAKTANKMEGNEILHRVAPASRFARSKQSVFG